MIELKKNEEQLSNEIIGKISLQKDKDNFKGRVVNLSKTVIDLSKEKQVDLGSAKAKVVMAIDYSGSMEEHYKSGAVQKVIEDVIPIGLLCDDDGDIPVYRFDSGCKVIESITIDNYSTYVKDILYKGDLGGTNYAPVLKKIIDDQLNVDVSSGTKKPGLFSKLLKRAKEERSSNVSRQDEDLPVLVLFITDGSNWDKDETTDIIRKSSGHKIYIKFIGVNKKPSEFAYLEELDDLDGRVRDNTGFTRFDSFGSMSDVQMYNAVLSDFADWLKLVM